MISILLGLKGALLRGALATVLSQEDDLRVVAESADGDEVLALAMGKRPDVAVLDFGLPAKVDVPEVCRQMRAHLPEIGLVIMLDRRVGAGTGRALARFSPRIGLVATDATPTGLIQAIRQTAKGEPAVDIGLAMAALTARECPLTVREREILRKAMYGAPARHIAQELFLSARTVQNCLSRVVAKTGARTRIEAIRIAQDAGWI